MTTIDKNTSDIIMISLYLVRDTHDNGMSLQEYADGVIAGTHPIIGHDEFVYQFGATDDNLQTVISWAKNNGLRIYEAHHGQSVVKVEGTVGTFNNLFNIVLQDVTDADRTYMMPNVSPTIPEQLVGIVESVPGFDQSFLAVKHLTVADAQTANPDTAVTPIQMATAYNIPGSNGFGACIGIFELTYSGSPEGWHLPDVTASFNRIGAVVPNIVTINVDSAVINSTSTAESMLDIYCAGAVAQKAKIAYYIAPNGGTQYIIDCINATANDTTNNPTSLGISWGIGDTTAYDSAFQACVAKGITVFVSSGDSGAANLSVSQSATSQYIVSAGGTSITLNGSNQITSEVAWSGSGGGISASIPLPSWQTGLTTTTITASSTGTPTALPKRGVPDISAPADPNTGYQFYIGGGDGSQGSLVQYGGTSASAPLLAGIWARLNQQLGNRIPFNMATWYTYCTQQSGTVPNPNLFNDTTSGDNRNGYTTGYATTTGWDPVTGVGSPKVDQIYQYFHTGSTFPKQNYGFRPTTGATYPRQNLGVR
jgi:kumamolisin